MSKEITHSLVLVLTIALAFLTALTPLAHYDLQIAAVLFILYYAVKRFYLPTHPRSHLLDSVVFTFVIVMVVMTSGSVGSTFFFLIYFLLFSLALFLEPVIAITATIALVIFFLFSLPPDQGLKTLMPIFSLAFLTPFAMYLGQEYQELQKSKTEITRLEEDNHLFNSLIVRNHIKTIRELVDNFMGDKELHELKRQANRLEKLVEEFERE
jgi:hypothetical protein